jgi:hypothetical protein
VVCFLNEDSAKHASILMRRFKRLYPASRVGAVLWSDSEHELPLKALKEADFIASNLTNAAHEALSNEAPSLLPRPRKIQIRTRRPTARASSPRVETET